MSFTLPSSILNLRGQVVKDIEYDVTSNHLTIRCQRDKRYKPIDSRTGQAGTINRFVRRSIKDLPLCGLYCFIDIELAEVRIVDGSRRIEKSHFVETGCYFTKRFCQLVSGLCRYMSIQAVAKHFKLRWETVKNMDKFYLQSTLPALDPATLENLKYIGVDEVARAKGHDYMTVVYDLVSGQLIWVHEGRTSMEEAVNNWCEMADQTNMIYMKKFAKSLRKNKVGICNYAKHPLTTARIEAGNVAIGMIRKRARGIRDTEYFKLKIRQLGTPEEMPMFYKSAA